MKRIASLVLLLVVALSTVVNAQEVKLLPWQEYWDGVKYTQVADGEWDFTHNGRSLRVNTLVGVPASVVSIRNMWRVTSTEGLTLYLVVLDTATAVRLDGKATSLRLTFTCREASDEECRAVLGERLRRGTAVQSLGVANSEDYASGEVPEMLIFSFHMNADGIYKIGAVEIPKF